MGVKAILLLELHTQLGSHMYRYEIYKGKKRIVTEMLPKTNRLLARIKDLCMPVTTLHTPIYQL